MHYEFKNVEISNRQLNIAQAAVVIHITNLKL